MAPLKGRATGIIDSKGRVSLPAKYRRLLPEDLVVTKSPDDRFPALVIYSSDDFENWMDAVLASKGGYRATSRNHDNVINKYYEDAEDVKIDGVGRILIPAELREYAGIEKDVVFSGARDRLIIRSTDIWLEYQKVLETVTAYDDSIAQV